MTDNLIPFPGRAVREERLAAVAQARWSMIGERVRQLAAELETLGGDPWIEIVSIVIDEAARSESVGLAAAVANRVITRLREEGAA